MPAPIRRAIACWAATLALLLAPSLIRAADSTPAKSQRLLYVCLDKDLAVFDIDAGHKFVRWIPLNSDPKGKDGAGLPAPVKGDSGAGRFRGICADPASGRLYVTYN